MDSFYQEVITRGELVKIAGNRPIFVEDKGYLYFVIEGSVDLFLFDIAKENMGRRHYLFSLQAGQIFTAINPLGGEQSAGKGSEGLLATALPDSKVYRIEFRDFLESIENYSQLVNTLESWIDIFYQKMNDFIETRYLNDFYNKWEEWIFADSVENIYERLKVDISSLIEQDKIVDFISDFNSLCFEAAVKKRNHCQKKEIKLFQEKIRKDEEIVNQSFQQIIGSYSKKDSIYLYNTENNLFTACQKVAEYLKVELKFLDKAEELTIEEIAETSQIRYRTVFLDGNWWQEDVGP
ncbi:MAG: cyclic nucleotide-binding domain-containing protein, partial [Halanaerobiales bacterium]